MTVLGSMRSRSRGRPFRGEALGRGKEQRLSGHEETSGFAPETAVKLGSRPQGDIRVCLPGVRLNGRIWEELTLMTASSVLIRYRAGGFDARGWIPCPDPATVAERAYNDAEAGRM